MTQEQIRYPAWAGSFYPADKNELTDQIKSLAGRPAQTSGILRGIIMPHAGYIYSGHTASYAEQDIHENKPETIILMGPDHHVGMATSHVCQKKYWQTPLGDVKISPHAHELLAGHPNLFQENPLADQKEHSLEVIVPFLQSWLAEFQIIPIVTGQIDPIALASALMPLLNNDTLLVISSDLSHFLSDNMARTKDRQTITAILEMDMDHLAINDNKACGLTPIIALLTIAQKLDWHPRLLHYSNSGDISGDTDRVVGYATIGLYEEVQNAT